jgi:hypothetical protein
MGKVRRRHLSLHHRSNEQTAAADDVLAEQLSGNVRQVANIHLTSTFISRSAPQR